MLVTVAVVVCGSSRRERSAIVQSLRPHKHLLLLITTVIGVAAQPLVHGGAGGRVAFELLGFGLLLAVFLVVLHTRREQIVALVFAPLVVGANIVSNVAGGATALRAALVFHSLTVVFLAFAVGVILRRVFHSGRIGVDEVFGSVAGYLLAGVAWSNLYVIVYLVDQNAFSVAADLAWQLNETEARRFLFSYFSFVTLTTMGYGDVTPLAPVACSLVWLEAVFGQFYMAVLVGQLVGIKLSQSRNAK